MERLTNLDRSQQNPPQGKEQTVAVVRYSSFSVIQVQAQRVNLVPCSLYVKFSDMIHL